MLEYGIDLYFAVLVVQWKQKISFGFLGHLIPPFQIVIEKYRNGLALSNLSWSRYGEEMEEKDSPVANEVEYIKRRRLSVGVFNISYCFSGCFWGEDL
jgi:hypothetical protein